MTPQLEKQLCTLQTTYEYYNTKAHRLKSEGDLIVEKGICPEEGERLLLRAKKYQGLAEKIFFEMTTIKKKLSPQNLGKSPP